MRPAPLFRITRLALLLGLHLALVAAREANADAVVRSASGPGPTIPAAVQTAVDQFRTDLGSLNANVAGSFMTGRREINWDGVPDASAAPNNLPADFFNVTSPRGVVFSTAGTGFRVSADSSNPMSTPHQFGDIDPGYPAFFEPFSAQRLFTPIGSNVMDVTFFVPGTTIPASVSGFGVVFSDVDTANATSIQFFDIAGNSLGAFAAPAAMGNQTFSFVGVSFNAGERAARVRITCGTQVLAAGNTAADLVVMDDFIYSEPVAYPDVIIVDSAVNMLFRFHSRTPGTFLGSYPVTGLVAGERLVAIDFRPATGELFGLVHNGGNSGRLITVPFTGGAVAQVGNAFTINGSNFGFDFNPAIDRIRITSDADQNFSVDPSNAVVTVQTPLNPGNPTVTGSAYTNNFPGATTTQLFGIEFGVDTLVSQSPPASGTLTTLGSLGVDTSGEIGFDIQGYTNSGYATLTLAGTSRLFTVDLDDGSARDLGVIGLGGIAGGMALVPQAPTTITPLNTPLLAVDGSNNLLLFNSDSPGSVTVRPITGLLSNEAIHGIDVRPATQTLYALGIVEGPGPNDSAARLYTINISSGVATPVASGNAPFSSSLSDNAQYGFDFNPVTDRIRIVNSADQNLRVNPNSGVLVQFDTPLANGATAELVSAVAYDRNDLDPATATTLYAINVPTNTLEIVGGINGASPQSANTGVLNVVGPLGSTLVTAVSGFDISPAGHAFAALTVTGGFCNLYSVELASGTAISRGPIAVAGSAIRGLTVGPQPCAITCPAAITVNTAPNQCSAVINYPPPTTTGVCGPVVVSPASGSAFPKGTTTVTATTQNGASCTFSVTVNDLQPPSFTCSANITQPADPGQNGAVVTFGPSTVADNCPSLGTPQFSPASGSFFPLGTTTVNAQVTDASGNSAACSFSVTITAPPPTPTPTPTPTPPVGSVGNVSTRLPVGTGDNVLIEGFIVQGPAGSTKKIMVRAIGPSLAPFGIPDALGNPTLEIRDGGNALIASNDDWETSQVGGIITGDQSGEIRRSGLAPGNSAESAIIAELAPGSYTAVVRGVNNTVGTGVVDAYDLSPSSPAKLANIATRGLIQPGDKLMIAGFIIQNGDVRLVVRAIGPSLSAFGVNNALPDTTLELRDQNGTLVRANDDWETDQKQALENSGLQPSDPKEAAVLATVSPGQYTVQVRGKPEGTGIGVVQVYFLEL